MRPRPWYKTHPKKYWTSVDWAAARKAGVAPPERPKPNLDPTERLLTEQAQAGPRVSWGPPPSQADARRRKVDQMLEKKGLRPRSRW